MPYKTCKFCEKLLKWEGDLFPLYLFILAVLKEFMMNIMVIMQGASGSGKSTLANDHLAPLLRVLGHDVVICSTDDFHKVDGVYKFQPEKLGLFHSLNQKKARTSLQEGKSVIIDNTNLAKWETAPYVKMAVEMGIPVSFHRANGNFNNLHGVPAEKVVQMRARMEELTIEGCLNATRT